MNYDHAASIINLNLSVIIMVFNEEKNIENCLKSVQNWVKNIFIVDSYSTDSTISIASKFTDRIYQIKYESFANKFNWSLNNLPISTEFILRLDADEVVLDPDTFFYELAIWIAASCNNNGLYINRRYYFLNHWIRHGGMYPRKVLRIWRFGKAFFEDRLIDEKMVLNGTPDFLNIDIADRCQKGIFYWIQKHIQYARREAIESGNMSYNKACYTYEFDRENYKNKRRYYLLPILIRPFLYFLFRVALQRGFMDGTIGMLYHFLHAFIYRELVDYFIIKRKLNIMNMKRLIIL